MLASRPVADAVFGLLFDCGFEAAFVVALADRRVIAANQRFEELLGRPNADVVGQPVTSVLAFEVGDLRDSSILEHPGHYEDVALTKDDGYPLYVTLTVAHVEHPELGQVAACLARDTTERGALERELLAKHSALYAAHAELERLVGELRTTQRQLEDRNHEISVMAGQVSRFGWRAAIGELCAGIAHNLNNPVGALLSTLRTLGLKVAASDRPDKAELEALLTRARTSATRIEEHVAAVVSVNRVGSLDAAPRNLDLAHELDTALTLFSGRLGPIELARDYAGPLPAHVPQDPLHHVLANVIDNAVKAMPAGGRLGVAVRRSDDRWMIEVSDTGGGLPAHVVARLFEPIVTARASGAGLGLATAQRLARSWGGDIVHHAVAAGACFAISVPAKELR
ncbi:MAG TPA: ATP-binding protein [Kofleriaceae bacterium]|nr:ATP-binding protein [Kofleriaceae bacterium]